VSNNNQNVLRIQLNSIYKQQQQQNLHSFRAVKESLAGSTDTKTGTTFEANCG
jgi:hypothetical protein